MSTYDGGLTDQNWIQEVRFLNVIFIGHSGRSFHTYIDLPSENSRLPILIKILLISTIKITD